MKFRKPRKKTTGYSIILLILITLVFLLNLSFFATAKSYEATPVYKFESDALQTSSDIEKITPDLLDNSQIIKPKEGVTIIPPVGSIVTHISSESVDIQFENESTTIYVSNMADSLSNISFHRSINGLDDFNMRISFAGYQATSSLSSTTIVNYSVDWGNGDVTTGRNIPTSDLIYTYRKEGKYPVNIKLTDSNGITYMYLNNQTFKLTTAQFVTFWVDENKETVAASSVGVGGVALLGFALTETGKYKFLALLPLLIPMYTRIQKEDVLDQFVRGEIYGFIKTNPGVHYNEIMRELDMKNGTLSYHLYMLEKTGVIKSRKEGFRYRAFYPTGMKFPEKERYRLTELQTKIIKTIKENPGINQKEIAKKLDEKHQTISYNIKVMQQAGIISLRKKGRKTSCYINEEISLQET